MGILIPIPHHQVLKFWQCRLLSEAFLQEADSQSAQKSFSVKLTASDSSNQDTLNHLSPKIPAGASSKVFGPLTDLTLPERDVSSALPGTSYDPSRTPFASLNDTAYLDRTKSSASLHPAASLEPNTGGLEKVQQHLPAVSISQRPHGHAADTARVNSQEYAQAGSDVPTESMAAAPRPAEGTEYRAASFSHVSKKSSQAAEHRVSSFTQGSWQERLNQHKSRGRQSQANLSSGKSQSDATFPTDKSSSRSKMAERPSSNTSLSRSYADPRPVSCNLAAAYDSQPGPHSRASLFDTSNPQTLQERAFARRYGKQHLSRLKDSSAIHSWAGPLPQEQLVERGCDSGVPYREAASHGGNSTHVRSIKTMTADLRRSDSGCKQDR